ncbi:hypothetical protein [uncultured Microbulbifer sp.]|uniref:hypothetical protein n=1 Tax=uncultured Microbulbifer sp. TaxID=348147 RepID=UPI002604ABF7|nr:hypothetical protein [uncultured Microbulbifer sp.]
MLYRTETAEFMGLEFASFRLAEGAFEKDLIALSKAVDESFLSEQEGLLSHFLLRGKDGVYADVAIATTQARAEEICQMWLDNAVAKQYLELLDQDSVDMSFWSRIT